MAQHGAHRARARAGGHDQLAAGRRAGDQATGPSGAPAGELAGHRARRSEERRELVAGSRSMCAGSAGRVSTTATPSRASTAPISSAVAVGARCRIGILLCSTRRGAQAPARSTLARIAAICQYRTPSASPRSARAQAHDVEVGRLGEEHVEKIAQTHALGGAIDDLDRVAGAELALLDDGEVEARSARGGEAFRAGAGEGAEARRELVARDAWLRDHEQGAARSYDVTDRELGVVEPVRRQILAESAPAEVRVRELAPPVRVVLRRIAVHRLVGPAVHREIGLPVAVEVVIAHRDAVATGALKIEVSARLSPHSISRGNPTLTDTILINAGSGPFPNMAKGA